MAIAKTTADRPEPKNNMGRWLSLLGSAAAAAFGVQSRKKLEADFAQKSPLPFVLIGIIGTALLVITLVLITRAVI